MAWRILFLITTVGLMIFFWHSPLIMPFKVFVVYLHELSHALGTFLTGGQVQLLSIDWDESGFTQSSGGNFLAVTGSGYLGSILFGSWMLRTAIISRYEKITALVIGLIVLTFPLLISQKLGSTVFVLGVFWGLLFMISGLLSLVLSRLLLFLMGGLTSLYALYDLGDFIRGDIHLTDAGIIAHHYVRDEFFATVLAYLIGFFISVLSVWILYKILSNAFHVSRVEQDEQREKEREIQDKIAQMEIISTLEPETIDLILKLHEQKKD